MKQQEIELFQRMEKVIIDLIYAWRTNAYLSLFCGVLFGIGVGLSIGNLI